MEIFVQTAQIASGVVAIVALIFTSTTFSRGRNTTGVTFLMTLNDKINQEKSYSLYVKIREGDNRLNWPDIDELLGLYEISYYAVRDLRVNKRSFSSLHSIRLKNIFSNSLIFEHKLVNEYSNWTQVYDLVETISPQSRTSLRALRKRVSELQGTPIHAGSVADKREAIYLARDIFLKSL